MNFSFKAKSLQDSRLAGAALVFSLDAHRATCLVTTVV